MPSIRIPFFTDHNVAESVGDALIAAGHEVTRLRNVMDTESPDPVVGATCALNRQVLVTHDKDFRKLTKRLGITRRQYHYSLHRVQLRCTEPEAARLVKDALSLIEHEWMMANNSGRRMVVEIGADSIRTSRIRSDR